MTIDELIELLQSFKEDGIGGDAEVRLMTQKSWPFENSIHGVCSSDDINAEAEQLHRDEAGDDYDEDDYELEVDEGRDIVYIVDGGQLGYGSNLAWDVAREC